MPITNLHNRKSVASLPEGVVIVLGYFDGVHMGHRSLFAEAKKLANGTFPICVWTFEKPFGSDIRDEITLTHEKSSLLADCGIDYTFIEDFGDFRGLSGQEFFESHIACHSPSAVVCGFNFTFGKGKSHNAQDLQKMAQDIGINCSVVPEYMDGGQTVSSSRIRKLIKEGKIEEANRLLCTPYSITTVIEHGVKLGRRMGIRTINQRLPENKVPPAHGVYCCTVTLENGTYGGICNIGSRPTVNDNQSDVTIETHIFDFDGEIYGESATVKLYRMLREERKFSDIDALTKQINEDIKEANQILTKILK